MKKAVTSAVMIVLAAATLTACKGKESMRAPGISSDDKNMSCEQLQLEMNDAAYLRDQAIKNRSFTAGQVLWPFSYPSTYSSAQSAVSSADARLNYLQRVYSIKKCSRPLS